MWVGVWLGVRFQNRQVRVGRTFSLYVGSCVGGCLPFLGCCKPVYFTFYSNPTTWWPLILLWQIAIIYMYIHVPTIGRIGELLLCWSFSQ